MEEVITWIIGLFAYYLGIVIRKLAMPGKDSPPLSKQFLLGIPFSIATVALFSTTMQAAVQDSTFSLNALVVAFGLIIEHGMILNEAASKRLHEIAGSREGSP